ncbi:AI-2E family transporter, partial [Mesorhizobium sp. M2D.F.Ca.ET.145.01.1.1]
LFIGPVLMALLVAIWREWLREVELADETAAGSAAEIEAGRRIEVLPEPGAAKKASA